MPRGQRLRGTDTCIPVGPGRPSATHRASTSVLGSASARTPIAATASDSCSSASAQRDPGRRARLAQRVSAGGGGAGAAGRRGEFLGPPGPRGGSRPKDGIRTRKCKRLTTGMLGCLMVLALVCRQSIDSERQTTACGASAAQLGPHPAPLHREHQAEAGVRSIKDIGPRRVPSIFLYILVYSLGSEAPPPP